MRKTERLLWSRWVNRRKGGTIMERYDWIVNIATTESCGEIYRFFGSKDEVKEKLMFLINEDRENDIDNWDYGCESINEPRPWPPLFKLYSEW